MVKHKNILRLLRHYPYTSICIILIWYLCFRDFSDINSPNINIPGIDKVVHFTMYCGTCSVMGWETLRYNKHIKRFKWCIWGIIMPIGMSALIEILQAQTSYRGGDITDLCANAVGVLAATLIVRYLLAPWHAKK